MPRVRAVPTPFVTGFYEDLGTHVSGDRVTREARVTFPHGDRHAPSREGPRPTDGAAVL